MTDQMPDPTRRMMIGGAALLAAGPAFATAGTVVAIDATDQGSGEIALWPGPPPNAPATLPVERTDPVEQHGRRLLQVRGVGNPRLRMFPAPRPDGRALLVLPGGGYGILAVTSEGADVARTFNPLGISVFVLTYRLPGEGWTHREDVPLQDAQRALRLIRANAGRWSVDPTKIGVVGFSAGGHLAVTLAKSFDESVYTPRDATDRLSARPDIAGLIYPVISMTTGLAHAGSRATLLGGDPTPGLVARRSGEQGVRADMSPLFLLHAVDDQVVPVDNSLAMLAGARAARIPAEMHLLQSGGHGFGCDLLPPRAPGRLWPALFDRWSQAQTAGTRAAKRR